MALNILFAAGAKRWTQYETPLRSALTDAGITARIAQDFPAACVDYIIYAPDSSVQDFRPYTATKAVLNLWAGVETIVGNQTLTQPLTRMVDPGLTQGMVEWVTAHVLRHHLDIDYFLANQVGVWTPKIPPLAQNRPVTILGMGALGAACGQALAALGFPVTGWSRIQKSIAGLTCLCGPTGLTAALQQAQILVLLLPNTPDTTGVINAQTLGQMPRGAVILNPGRGALIDDDALIAALNSDQIGHATLDVFNTEPLPADHPYWSHPKVTVTPHIASETRPASAALTIVQNIARAEAGQPLLHLVDRRTGY